MPTETNLILLCGYLIFKPETNSAPYFRCKRIEFW